VSRRAFLAGVVAGAALALLRGLAEPTATMTLIVRAPRSAADEPKATTTPPSPEAQASAAGSGTWAGQPGEASPSTAPTRPAAAADPASPGPRPPTTRPPSTRPTAPPATRALTGLATWLVAPVGTAAAGPALRAALGPTWRGKLVCVGARGGASCIEVRLTDWCACRVAGQERLIDLAREDFAQLADPSRGVLDVVVHL